MHKLLWLVPLLLTLLTGCAVLPQPVNSSSNKPEEYRYNVRKTLAAPDLSNWLSSSWAQAETGSVNNYLFDPNWTTRYLPETKFRMLYDHSGIYVIFLVHDQFVSASRGNMEAVCLDSSVEFFIAPVAGKHYFNFEINAAGSMYVSYRDASSTGSRRLFTMKDIRRVKVVASLAGKLDKTINKPVSWTLGVYVPFAVLTEYCGSITPASGQSWRGNFYKCSYVPQNPHWSSWAKLPVLNFHAPKNFGHLIFK